MPLAAPAPPPPAPPSPERVSTFRSQQQSAADAGQLGDLFEYKLKEPVTIHKSQSALVPILSGEVEAEKVSLWNASSGGARPLRAVWVTNATGLTLDGGSFSVIEGQVFAGEGLVEPLKAGERRLLSYAADLGVRIDSKGENTPAKVTRVTVARGLVTQQTEERQRRTYTARNEDTEPRVLVIEHPVRAGWTIGGTLTPAESTAEWHRFKLPVAPKTTVNFVVEETRQGQMQYSVSSITDDQIAVLVRDNLITPQTAASLRQIQSQKAEVARLGSELAERDNEIDAIGEDQDRVRENMKSLKGSAEEKQLLRRYVKQLDDQENRLEVLRRESQKLSDDRQKAQVELNRLIEGISGQLNDTGSDFAQRPYLKRWLNSCAKSLPVSFHPQRRRQLIRERVIGFDRQRGHDVAAGVVDEPELDLAVRQVGERVGVLRVEPHRLAQLARGVVEAVEHGQIQSVLLPRAGLVGP